jgi:hypothetical protein
MCAHRRRKASERSTLTVSLVREPLLALFLHEDRHGHRRFYLALYSNVLNYQAFQRAGDREPSCANMNRTPVLERAARRRILSIEESSNGLQTRTARPRTYLRRETNTSNHTEHRRNALHVQAT